MDIGKTVEIGERKVDIPKLRPQPLQRPTAPVRKKKNA